MSTPLSRRILFEVGAGALIGAALAPGAASAAGAASENEMIIRKWYGLWITDQTNWAPFDAMLADDFTFSSAAPDDHISKAAFKRNCWETQVAHMKGFDLELMMAKDDAVFVKYLCHTTSGSSFRNVELLRLRGGRIESIECYFGGPGYPTAADAHKS
jgi:hypothetical protein